MEQETISKIIEELRKELPSIVRFSKLPDYPSFPYAQGTVHNELCAGTGPENTFLCGRHRCAFRGDMLAWVGRKLSREGSFVEGNNPWPKALPARAKE